MGRKKSFLDNEDEFVESIEDFKYSKKEIEGLKGDLKYYEKEIKDALKELSHFENKSLKSQLKALSALSNMKHTAMLDTQKTVLSKHIKRAKRTFEKKVKSKKRR